MNEQIKLITVTRTLTNGQETATESAVTVWAGVRSVTYSEYYQSYQAGLNASLIFKVNTAELGAAEYVEYDGKRYRILRTYRIDAQYTEITVEELRGAPAAQI